MSFDPSKFRTPGQYIESLLEERQWTQGVASIMLGLDKATLSKIILGRRPVSAELAIVLSELFEIPAERFLELQKSIDLAQARLITIPDPVRAQRAHLFGRLPVAEMMKRGWIDGEDIRDVPNVEAALTKFFHASSAEEIEILPLAAKKTNVSGEVTPVQLAWVYRVREIARELVVPRFSQQGTREAVAKLASLLASEEGTRKVPRILTECGIRFVIVEALTASKIDGVCFWLDDESPVIGLSLRHDRIDNFWFVLRHELEHVLQGHGKNAIMLDADLEGERAGTGANVAEEERIANAAAANFCVPTKQMDAFIARKQPFFAERDLIGFARTLSLHPGLVAGQLQHRTGRYDRFRQHLAKVRSAVTPSAFVDGWGDVYPLGI